MTNSTQLCQDQLRFDQLPNMGMLVDYGEAAWKHSILFAETKHSNTENNAYILKKEVS